MGNSDNEHIAIAIVRKPIGLTGSVGATVFGTTLETLKLPCKVFLQRPSGIELSATLAQVRFDKRGAVCLFTEFSSVEMAEDLRGAMLLVQRNQLPPTRKDQYYFFELQGLQVESIEGEAMGVVVDVQEYPSVHAIEIERSDGQRFMAPLTKEAVPKIDLQRRVITVSKQILEELL